MKFFLPGSDEIYSVKKYFSRWMNANSIAKVKTKGCYESNVKQDPSKKYVKSKKDFFTALIALNFVGKSMCYSLQKIYFPSSSNNFVFVSLFTETTS